MKLVIAYIRPERLNQVKQALAHAGIIKMSVTNSMGCGQQGGYTETWRGADVEVNLLHKVRLEIGVNNDFVQKTVDAIIDGARSEGEGQIGDGKIFVLDMVDCIRIRTGENGKEAIG